MIFISIVSFRKMNSKKEKVSVIKIKKKKVRTWNFAEAIKSENYGIMACEFMLGQQNVALTKVNQKVCRGNKG